MRFFIRKLLDKVFTTLATASALLMVFVLLFVLVPMIRKGASAVVFAGTVEFRKMQNDIFGRGNTEDIQTQIQTARVVRKKLYDFIDDFKRGLDSEDLTKRTKLIYRNFSNELRQKNISNDEYARLRKLSRNVRNELTSAFELTDKGQIKAHLAKVDEFRTIPEFKDTAAEKFFALADEFASIVENIDLNRRAEFAYSLAKIENAVVKLLGPAPDEPIPALVQNRYGCTRMDMAKKQINNILYAERWVPKDGSKTLVKIRTLRSQQFAGTKMEELFRFVKNNTDEMLLPKSTFYWQYFIDDSTAGHYFGGVGPEILGTLILTVLSMLFAFPLGVISAAKLVECSSNGITIRIIRMCINSLAGVPSVVFGLFGLAFFVMYLLPAIGASSNACILTASLTLAVLTLPVMIRASEEAIRSVPQTYKEASFALGATGFRTFVKVTLPAALPGILTGVILSISRVAGETAPILFTGAVALGSLPKSIFDPTRTLSYGSYDIAVGDRLAMQVPHNQYGMVVTLILLIILLNAAAIFLRAKLFKKLKGL